jgi:hypothetical protein
MTRSGGGILRADKLSIQVFLLAENGLLRESLAKVLGSNLGIGVVAAISTGLTDSVQEPSRHVMK